MSFSFYLEARSRRHALDQLEKRKLELPAEVHGLIKTAIDNINPPPEAQTIVLVEATGHLNNSGSTYDQTDVKICVRPIFIRD